jgi:hypothetical protein
LAALVGGLVVLQAPALCNWQRIAIAMEMMMVKQSRHQY